jgi:hypothetical protein
MLGGLLKEGQDQLSPGVVRGVCRDQVEALVPYGFVPAPDADLGVIDPVPAEVGTGQQGRPPVDVGQHDLAPWRGSGRSDSDRSPSASEVEDSGFRRWIERFD